MENGEIQDIVVERASGKGIVGNIYKGRVTRVLPGMQAAFVDIGLEKAAFLYVDDVFVRSEVWEQQEEEGGEDTSAEPVEAPVQTAPSVGPKPVITSEQEGAATQVEAAPESATEATSEADESEFEDHGHDHEHDEEEDDEDDEIIFDEEDEEEDDEDDRGPVGMGPGDGGDEGSDSPEGTIQPPAHDESSDPRDEGSSGSEGGDEGDAGAEGGESDEGAEGAEGTDAAGGPGQANGDPRRRGRRSRRGRRGGRNRKRGDRQPGEQQAGEQEAGAAPTAAPLSPEEFPDSVHEQLADHGDMASDRAQLSPEGLDAAAAAVTRPPVTARVAAPGPAERPEFREQRGRDRKIRSRPARAPRAPVNIQDLLKEGQEVLVQVAKDPIATKGARLTCHISLPGRHLVCMPTIDHVGVSRRIERDDERRKLRDLVEKNRPRNVGFIVRTASGRGQSEKRIKQDIDYLTRLWTEIREKAAAVTAPAMVYEDLNPVLRAIRDWVTEDIDRIVVDSRYHFNEIQRFVSHFMPPLKQKIELYHGDIPIFDAYNISTELARALERKVWLKSGGYLVIDQAEALVAIDVNTGRYVGKKNLEDTILKTNLEAVQEIAYQLRLRNAGGIIILDLIDMEKEENKQRVYRALEEAIKRDRARPSILKISELGLVEMTRKRTRDTMVRALCESCPACEGKGFVKSKQTVAYEVMREVEREGVEREISKVLVQAHPDVIDILAIDERETLDHLERRYRKQIFLQAVTEFHQEQFEVVGDKKPRVEIGGRDRDRERDRGREPRRGGDRDRGREPRRGGDRDRSQQGRQGGQQQPRPLNVPRPLPVITTGVSQAGGASPLVGEAAAAATEPGNMAETLAGNTGAPASVQVPEGRLPVIISKSLPQPVAQPGEPGEENIGNQAPGASGGGAPAHDDFSEEDRLAFLRAQAAQDAALARLRTNDPLGRASQGGGQGGRGGEAGGRGGRGGRTGGRGGRGGGRTGGRGPQQAGGRGKNPRWGGRRDAQGPGAGPDVGNSAPVNSTSPDTGNGNGGGNNDGGGDAGGGGDHSTPPV